MASLHTIRNAYWIVFFGTFLSVAIWESLRPKRTLQSRESGRWTCHFILLFSQSFLLYGVLRWSGPILTAIAFADSRYGLLNRTAIPLTIRCILTVLVLDLLKFTTHWACHATPLLWRLHQVHHSDPDFDVTTGGRFHPIEAALSVAAQMAVIAVLAPPLTGVFIWQLMTVFQSLFAHANARLPEGAEKAVRTVFFTPDLHRIHHSSNIAEQNTNFGDLFPIWDRLFRTYRTRAAAGQSALETGLTDFPQERVADLLYLLRLPFSHKPGKY